ncbi:hypothetical protein Hanom_Chr17g01582841 [Helianthus anomalus]
MELTSQMKMARFQNIWIQMRKNKPLNESRKTGQTSGAKIAYYSKKDLENRYKKILRYRFARRTNIEYKFALLPLS